MSKPKLPAPRRVFIRSIRHWTQDDIAGRATTAIGLSHTVNVEEVEVFFSPEAVIAALALPEPPAPPPPKPVPIPPPTIMLPPFPRPDPEKIALTKDEPDLKDVIQPTLQNLPTNFFLAGPFNPTDVVSATVPGFGAQRGKLGEIRDLSLYSKIGANPLALDPKRKFLVIRFTRGSGDLDSQFKKLSYLGRKADLRMVVADAETLSLEGWLSVESLSKKQTENVFRLACELGCDPVCGRSNFQAVMPQSPARNVASGARAALYSLGYPRCDHDSWVARNYVLLFKPTGSEGDNSP